LTEFSRTVGQFIEILRFSPLFHDFDALNGLDGPNENSPHPFPFCREIQAEMHAIDEIDIDITIGFSKKPCSP